jgi:lycopene cyclase domain-containing protein
MPYSIFLIFFVVLPISGVLFALRRSLRRIHILSLFVLAVVAIVYATAWDNYVVAAGVKYYDPRTLLNLILGYVPIEDYFLFILQAILIGLFTLWLWRRFYRAEFEHRSGERHHDPQKSKP